MLKRALSGVAAIAVVVLNFVPTSSLAMGSDSSSSASAPPKCQDGKVWDAEARNVFTKGKCVAASEVGKDQAKPKAEKQSLIYDEGAALARAGRYDEALVVLAAAPDQDDPRIQNYLGYANRKLGNVNLAMMHYHRAIAADPDFALVREYLGEAYLELGLLEAAREQLTEIERICGGRDCEAYGTLAGLMVDRQVGSSR